MSILLSSYHLKFLAGNGWKCNILIWNQLFLKEKGPFFTFPSKVIFYIFDVFLILAYISFSVIDNMVLFYTDARICISHTTGKYTPSTLFSDWKITNYQIELFKIIFHLEVRIYQQKLQNHGERTWANEFRSPSGYIVPNSERFDSQLVNQRVCVKAKKNLDVLAYIFSKLRRISTGTWNYFFPESKLNKN